jgi:DNA-binding NarL/FixJ family response regulator
LSHVLTALNVPCVAIAAPSTESLATATLWVCDDLAFAAASSVPRSLRVVVFSADCALPLPNVEVLPPTTPIARLLDLAAAWSNLEVAPLSSREREILSLVSRGLSNEAIAAACFVSKATVKTHLLRSFRKLGVSDRAAAVYKAVKMGLIV